MQVNNAKDVIICRLGGSPVLYGSQVITNMNIAGRLNTGKYALLEFFLLGDLLNSRSIELVCGHFMSL